MTYPMLGDGANDFSRSGGDFEHTYLHYFTILTGENWSMAKLAKSRASAVNILMSAVASRRDHLTWGRGHKKSENPHLLPHGGTKWGNRFHPVQFRLDKNSRKRRFVARRQKGAK